MKKTVSKLGLKYNIHVTEPSEVSRPFLQRMSDAMGISYFKYGKVADSAGKTNCLNSARSRMELYSNGGIVKGVNVPPGNIWYLADAANFLMMESMHPTIPGAQWGSNESDTSPGRVLLNGRVTENDNHGRTQKEKSEDSVGDLLQQRIAPIHPIYKGRTGD